jgi:hypothetical protein
MIKFEEIQSRIYTIHDVQVMLDEDLAKFYGVETQLSEFIYPSSPRFSRIFFWMSESVATL